MAGQSDANGNASIRLQGNYELSRQAAWNLFVTLDPILNGIVTVLVDGVAVEGGLTTNRQFKCGPVFTNQNSQLQVTVTGMSPNVNATVNMQGILSEDISDFAALASPGYGGGSVQNDPSQLLTAELGPPLVENQTYAVPGTGSHEFFVGDFNISGYGALLVYGNLPNPASNLFLWMQFDDQLGNRIAFSQIDAFTPKFICVFGCYGTQVEIWIGNPDAGQHNVNQFTVIPLTSMPSIPSRLIPVAFGTIGAFASGPISPTANEILGLNSAVAASTTVTVQGNYVWYGRALWSVSPVSSGAGGISTWWATLQTIDANGVPTSVDVITGSNTGGAPREVWLPPGTPQMQFRNLGAGSITPQITLMAA